MIQILTNGEFPNIHDRYGVAEYQSSYIVVDREGNILSLAKRPKTKEEALEYARYASLAFKEAKSFFITKLNTI